MSVSTEDRDISLVERLRFGGPNAAEVAGQAADEIESNRKRIAELESALQILIEDVENKWGDPHTLHDARRTLGEATGEVEWKDVKLVTE